MRTKSSELVSRVERELGTEAAYAVSVALHAADTLRQEQPEKFKQAWGTMGYEAIEELFNCKPEVRP